MIVTGRIIKGIGGFYYVETADAGIFTCRAKGGFRKEGKKPLVGDVVRAEVLDAAEKTGNVTEILPRSMELIRPAVANVDQVFLVMALTDPEPNVNLLDRFLVFMERRNLSVVIIFTKSDLVGDRTENSSIADLYRDAGYRVLVISTRTGEGLPELQEALEGKVTALAGPSGVGKSTLTNYLVPGAEMDTGELSEKIRRGKQTTRHTELFRIRENTFLLDTPGFSVLELPDFPEEELKEYFPEFAPFSGACRFLGCVHIGERDCGVKRAVADGRIWEERYQSYRQIYEEMHDRRKW